MVSKEVGIVVALAVAMSFLGGVVAALTQCSEPHTRRLLLVAMLVLAAAPVALLSRKALIAMGVMACAAIVGGAIVNRTLNASLGAFLVMLGVVPLMFCVFTPVVRMAIRNFRSDCRQGRGNDSARR